MRNKVLPAASALACVTMAAVIAPLHAQTPAQDPTQDTAQGSTQDTTATATGAGPVRTFTGQDLFGLAMASDPQISPDGSTIIYTRRQNDVMSDRALSTLWAIDVASGVQTPFAGRHGSAFGARWSPDGSRVAYIATEGGSAQLWVQWVDSGAAVKLTGLASSPSSITWSPDGETIAYSMFVNDKPPSLGSAPTNRPQGAAWAPPLDITDLLNFRADGAGGSASELYSERSRGHGL